MASVEAEKQGLAKSPIARIARIVAAYLAACIAAGLAMNMLSILFEGQVDPVVERSFVEEVAQQIGIVGIFAFFTAIFAAPIGMLAILVTELAKLRHPAAYALAGALAAVPAMFRSGGIGLAGLSVLAPVGVLAGLAFWYVRHRLWKK